MHGTYTADVNILFQLTSDLDHDNIQSFYNSVLLFNFWIYQHLLQNYKYKAALISQLRQNVK